MGETIKKPVFTMSITQVDETGEDSTIVVKNVDFEASTQLAKAALLSGIRTVVSFDNILMMEEVNGRSKVD